MTVSKTFQGTQIKQFVSGNFSMHSLQSIYDSECPQKQMWKSTGEIYFGERRWMVSLGWDIQTWYWLGLPSDITGLFLPTWMSLSKRQVEQDGTEGCIIYPKEYFSLVYSPWKHRVPLFFEKISLMAFCWKLWSIWICWNKYNTNTQR